jgi:hypothetical protein
MGGRQTGSFRFGFQLLSQAPKIDLNRLLFQQMLKITGIKDALIMGATMMKNENFKLTILVACLTIFMACPVFALKKQRVYTQGNNVGLILDVLTQPMNSSDHNSYKVGRVMHSFPRGSGNYYGYLIQSFHPVISRDTDGDGTAEDTARIYMRGRGLYGQNVSIESYDVLKSLYDQGLVMQTYGRDIERNQMYTSKDPEDLAEWPVEFREGRSPSGAPIVHGAETVVGRYGDIWRVGLDLPIGVSAEYSWYFLDYGLNNNMVYSHVLMRNVSEYIKWSDMEAARLHVQSTPDGQNWHDVGLCLSKAQYFLETRGSSKNCIYLYHKGQNISGHMDADGISESFTPTTSPVIVEKMLRAPSFKGETMENKFCHVSKGTDFGVDLVNDYLENAKPPGVMLRAFFGDESLYPGVINIWTGRQTAGGWPGVILPEDEFYNKWIWGGGSSSGPNQQYIGWGMIHDVAPRDTFSFDWVHMCVPMEESFEVPPREVQYVGDEGIQEHLKPVDEYGATAQAVLEGGYILPETPVPPPLTIIPGDREITITWSDINIKTPDNYYYFLQENNLNPDGLYQEYDFEGYRLYRSFVGPNDSHAELIYDGSLSANNVRLYYIDKLEDDINYSRMRNGLKVWYSLVPYDKNYDFLAKAEFSLPDLTGGKVWNKPANTPGLYNLMPRSEASNFKSASMEGEIAFTPAWGTASTLKSVDLSAPGDGSLADAPVFLEPVVSFEFTPVINERITSEKTINVNTSGKWIAYTTGTYNNHSVRTFQAMEGSSTGIESGEYIVRARSGASQAIVSLSGPADAEGTNYAISATFEKMSDGDLRTQQIQNMDTGTYAGVETGIAYRYPYAIGGNPPAIPGQVRAGRFTLTWQANGDNLTLQVQDQTRGYTLPFVEFPDQDYGWGFVTPEIYGDDDFMGVNGNLYEDMLADVPFSQRTAKMISSLPADNTDNYAIWVNGLLWYILDVESMPANGTVFTVDNAFGVWNSDKTVFTQWPDPPFPGDKWQLQIKPMSLDPDDADLQKIRVVPNPYICSSFLDLSPSSRRIEFINLPDRCTIRIFTLSGNLVNVLNHIGASRLGWGDYTDWDALSDNQPRELTGWDNHSGTEAWNLRNRFGTTVASGLYFYHVTDARGETYTGKFYVIN